ncbi:ssDNA-dependent ATPase MGS1 [Sugiyamaella lignohabitans]|uniref:SsDNA-dependent ATPase MGS1 n=1 Tax=Sugiyamaella lignohabitans TaxID=796027 RepID=A0A167CZF3_9ASCO|nr:ssDNA-dependent ATPase MGS1 [Sugiyamaella lignohabitans]ANB12290.1 ssDNA-dependent ATPase MGS1 [Sugiyamaella lignohabitans]
MSGLVRCPLCDMETTEVVVNRHLDKGCPPPEGSGSDKISQGDSGVTPGVGASGVKQSSIFSQKAVDNRSGGPSSSPLSGKKNSGSGTGMLVDRKRSFTASEQQSSKPMNKSQNISQSVSGTSGRSDVNSGEERGYRDNSRSASNAAQRDTRKRARLSAIPLAEQVRPKSLDDFVGQEDLIGKNGLLRKFVERDVCPSIILWGPSGVGKTSFARILANSTKSRFIELSAAIHGINECKKIFEEARNDFKLFSRRTILFLDEIHRFNRAQQDIFLPHVEKGDITLIGATTENPSFKLNGALLSRCRVLVLHKLKQSELSKIIANAIDTYNKSREQDGLPTIHFEQETIEYLAGLADGDGRIGLNLLEITINDASVQNSASTSVTSINNDDQNRDLTQQTEQNEQKENTALPTSSSQASYKVSTEHVKTVLQRTHMLYDRVGDSHYDTISALHKSVRGSDPDAALFYLGRMLEAGEDPLYVARRMVRMASEDIGQADESCLPFAVAAFQAVQQIGMPEADCILAHCAVKLAEAKKSVRVYRAYNAVKSMLRTEPGAAAAVVPIHLRNAPTRLMKEIGYGKEYKYNPDYEDGKVRQTYMPEGLETVKFLSNKHLGPL